MPTSHSTLPIAHVAIIPDGNRRWAKKGKLPTGFGHRAGAKNMEQIIRLASDLGIPYLTIWGCSVSNITIRSSAEVRLLMKVFQSHFEELIRSKKLKNTDTRVRILGRWKEIFPESVGRVLQKAIDSSKKNVTNNLTFLMAYDGREEMLAAAKSLADERYANSASKVTPEILKRHLWTHDLPPVDLVIRTGGEPHWSAGFMMWDVAEARLHFTETLWPDFSPVEFKKIIDTHRGVERRFGK